MQETREEFKKLINNVELTCILVPWCIDMETKGKLKIISNIIRF